MRSLPIRAARAVIVALALAGPTGCGYSIRPPFDANIKTVYVPVFRSFSFYKDINFRLTELLIKEIKDLTPYKVVGSPEEADSTLEGITRFFEKNIMLENPYNLPRHLSASITVEVR